MVFENLLDPIFSPLLNLPSLLTILLLSFLISLVITLITKYATDQDLMKRLKDEMKELQAEIKELKKDPEKAMQVQKQVMQTNMKYMKQSFKSMFYTFIPIIIIFSWMTANLAYDSILPGQDFTTSVVFQENAKGAIELSVPGGIIIDGGARKEVKDSSVKWILNGKEGEYLLEYIFDGKKYTKEVLITEKNKYKEPVKRIKGDIVKSIEIEHKQKKILNLFGWKIGWLGSYIIFSIIFSIGVRKVIKVY
ncbi:MAG: EMC3/TMCO1 family protein [Candidatus Woesearchaeota archaeon]|nr:EMC3/TMCO1 family protein [Candidatus Woesearchaeota archaeon]MDP7322766.1 EMC3/TMCO1 family protein [Candidatus Woesearchaeota archaeon]MDP7476048.1 EMC3/TMCO1 family protein [Candidatus Woesearchaeota archaeon]